MTITPIHLQVFADSAASVAGNPLVLYLLEDLSSEHNLTRLADMHTGIDVCFIAITDDFIDVRWFNGLNEIQFCGHGALAAAWWLSQSGVELRQFRSPAGGFTAVRHDSTVGIRAHILAPVPLSNGEPEIPGQPEAVVQRFIEPHTKTVLLECVGPQTVGEWQPDFDRLLELSRESIGALILFCRADNQYDGYLRYFAPWYGKNEDIATGSAMRMLFALLEGESLKIRQLSAPGGVLHVSRYSNTSIVISGAVTQSRSLPE